jgi:hypothetical protein
MNYMECLLSNRFYLKYLELRVKGNNDLTEGQRWQLLTTSLIEFNFKINVDLQFIEVALDSFRTSFWLEEKRWFVAYEDGCFYSYPYFAPKQVCTSYQPSIHCTAFDNRVIFKSVTKLDVVATQTFTEPFTHVNMLDLQHAISQTKLLRFVDVRHVKHLSILSLNDLLQFPRLKRKMPFLCRLSIKNNIRTEEVKQMINSSYEQIRTLEIKINCEKEDYIIEELFRLFPYTEQLIHKSDIESIEIMVRFIDGFKHLLNASFFSCDQLYNNYRTFIYDSDLIILQTKRLISGLTICRVYHLPHLTSVHSIDWWIEN